MSTSRSMWAMPRSARQSSSSFGSRPGVDERDLARAAHETRVALPDVAHRDLPVGGTIERASRTASPPAMPRPRATRPATIASSASRLRVNAAISADDGQRGEQERRPGMPPGHGSARNGSPGEEGRNRGDPARRQPRQRCQRIAQPRHDRQQHARREADHGRDRRGGLGEQVRDARRRSAASAAAAASTGWQHSCAASGTAMTSASPRRQPALGTGRGQRTGEQEQPAGRQHGQHEAVVAREPRVGDEQHDDREREHRHPAHRPPARECARARAPPSPRRAARSARA